METGRCLDTGCNRPSMTNNRVVLFLPGRSRLWISVKSFATSWWWLSHSLYDSRSNLPREREDLPRFASVLGHLSLLVNLQKKCLWGGVPLWSSQCG
jgi:hypothetical protein